jgi:phage tail-like protein
VSEPPTYRYLKLEGAWPTFELSGLVAGDGGALALAPLPLLADPLGAPLAPLPGLDGPAGIGVACDGTIYVADAAGDRVLRVDPCDGTSTPLHCLRGPGSGPGQVRGPRGVLVGRPPRDALYVADSGNARVLVIDRATEQLRDVWGVPRGDPRPSDAPGGFVQPWDLAADRAGRVYVADPGEQDAQGRWSRGRVQQFRADGTVVAAFASAVAAQPSVPGAPASVAVTLLDPADRGSERLVVLDRQPPRLLVYALDGTLDADATARWAGALGTGVPTSVAASDGVLYVADARPGADRVLVFALDGAFLGVAPAAGAAAGLAVDCAGRLLLNPGGAGGAVQRALGLPTYAECGTFLAGPFDAASEPTRWQRIALEAELPDGAHVRLYTLTSDTADGTPGNRPAFPAPCGAPVLPDVVSDEAELPAPLDRWRAAPADAADVLAANEPARFLWVAGVLQGDGSATPTIRQIRLSHDEEGWIRYLPRLYQRPEGGRVFLERLLAAFEGVLAEADAEIDALPRLFDPYAAPDPSLRSGQAREEGGWLEWLAGWVDAELRETWPDAQRRQVVAEAFGAHARRGTLGRLRRLVALHTGATPFIEELGAAGVWSLGGSSALGFDTALAEASGQGAVLATTAVVDHSHLTDGSDPGAPAFAGLAHRFAVHVYAAELDARAADPLAPVRAVLDGEKPAHTTYHLCAIGPTLRVGSQARVGIDAIVAGPAPATPLGAGDGLVLGGETNRTAAVGVNALVGAHATVT